MNPGELERLIVKNEQKQMGGHLPVFQGSSIDSRRARKFHGIGATFGLVGGGVWGAAAAVAEKSPWSALLYVPGCAIAGIYCGGLVGVAVELLTR